MKEIKFDGNINVTGEIKQNGEPFSPLPEATSADENKVLTVNNEGKAEWKEASVTKGLVFENVQASNWVEDDTFLDYTFKCDLNTPGITANSYVIVNFLLEDIESGLFSPVCESGQDKVTIWANANITTTIPLIKEVL